MSAAVSAAGVDSLRIDYSGKTGLALNMKRHGDRGRHKQKGEGGRRGGEGGERGCTLSA